MTEIVMPQQGAEMEEGAIVRWLKQPGEFVSRGDEIADIETDKATVQLEAYEEGYFLGGIVDLNVTVPVGTVIGYLGVQGEQPPAGAAPSDAPQPAAALPADRQAEFASTTAPAGATPPAPSDPAPTAQVTPPASAPRGAAERAAAEGTGQAAQPVGEPAAGATDAEPAPVAPAGSDATLPSQQAGGPAGRTGAATGGNGVGPAPAPTMAPPAEGGRLRASPVARSMAEEAGIDLARVHGSGPEGRIMRRDVEEAIQAGEQTAGTAAPAVAVVTSPPPVPEQASWEDAGAPAGAAVAAPTAPTAPTPIQPATPARASVPAAAPQGGVEPLSRMRQTIARRMSAAKRDIPHYYLTASADMEEAMALRSQLNAALPDARVSVNDLIVKACALALERYPRFNATFTDDGLRMNERINIGIAVALEDGLIVPAVLDVAGRSLGAIARASHDVTERARGGRLRGSELSDGTFTVSNLGMYGVDTLVAIIQPGQSAILGVGKVEPRAVVRDGQVVPRQTMMITLSADHRVSDGAQGAQFLAAIREALESPMRLVM